MPDDVQLSQRSRHSESDRRVFQYPSFAGPGDVNESYDAADFHNMFLAWQTVTPRAQGRVVQDNGRRTDYIECGRSDFGSHEVLAARSDRCAAAVVPSAGPGEFLVSPDAEFAVAESGDF